MRVICRTLNWSSTMRTLRAAAFGILVTPIGSRRPAQWSGVAMFLVDGRGCRGRRGRRSGGPRMRGTIGRQLRKLLDVENEGDPSVAEDSGGCNPGDCAVALLDALDDHLLMAAQLVDHEAKPRSLTGLSNNDDAVGEIAHLRRDVEQLAEVNNRHEVSAQSQHAPSAEQFVDVRASRTEAFHNRRHR